MHRNNRARVGAWVFAVPGPGEPRFPLLLHSRQDQRDPQGPLRAPVQAELLELGSAALSAPGTADKWFHLSLPKPWAVLRVQLCAVGNGLFAVLCELASARRAPLPPLCTRELLLASEIDPALICAGCPGHGVFSARTLLLWQLRC